MAPNRWPSTSEHRQQIYNSKHNGSKCWLFLQVTHNTKQNDHIHCMTSMAKSSMLPSFFVQHRRRYCYYYTTSSLKAICSFNIPPTQNMHLEFSGGGGSIDFCPCSWKQRWKITDKTKIKIGLFIIFLKSKSAISPFHLKVNKFKNLAPKVDAFCENYENSFWNISE